MIIFIPGYPELPPLLRAPSGFISEHWRSVPAHIEPCATSCVQCSGQRFFDVNLRDPWVYVDRIHWSLQHADIVKANDAELERITQLLGLGETIR